MLFVVSLAAAGCSSEDGLDAGDAATVAAGFVAEVAVDGADWSPIEGGEAIPDGAQVRTAGDELRLTFRDGNARLSPDAQATLTADRITVELGEVLINSDGDLGAAVDDTTVTGAALYRLSSGLAARVGVYRGEVAVRRPAQERTVAALRELDIADFRLATSATPLQYGDSDSWDQELLADAIAFDGEAARLQRGMDLELGTRPLAPTFYREFASAAAVPVLASVAPQSVGRRFGPPSAVLLTVFVARAASGETFDAAVSSVTGLRRDGARWGLIALELDVASDRVVAAIDRLGNRSLALADLSPADRSGELGIGGTVDGSGAGSAGAGDDGAQGGTSAGNDSPTGGGGPPRDGDDNGSGTGGEDPPTTSPPGGGGGEDPDPPPPPPPSEGPIEQVVNGVVSSIDEPPDDDDVESGLNLPSALDPVVKPVRDLLSGD